MYVWLSVHVFFGFMCVYLYTKLFKSCKQIALQFSGRLTALAKDNTVKVCGQMHHLQWTSSLVTLSSHLIFSIVLHIHISKATNLFLPVSVNVHISATDSLHLGNLTFVVLLTLVEACTVWVFSSWCYIYALHVQKQLNAICVQFTVSLPDLYQI